MCLALSMMHLETITNLYLGIVDVPVTDVWHSRRTCRGSCLCLPDQVLVRTVF